jgi:hypothetical protein
MIHKKENRKKVKQWVGKLKRTQQDDLFKAKIDTDRFIKAHHVTGQDLIDQEADIDHLEKTISSIKKVIRNLKRER